MILEMIRFEHTIFALPFALIGMLLASRQSGVAISAHIVLWILAAMVGARSAAMSFNRLADAPLDAQNPRTKSRHIPSGLLTRGQVAAFLVASIVLFEVAAWQLNPLCLLLSPVALFIVLGYSYTKRFTSLCHLFLGLGTGIAPIGAWVAVTGRLLPIALLLGLVVLLWIGGFDIIYALQDYDHDVQTTTMHSLPKRIGKRAALWVSRAMHACMIAVLVVIGLLAHLHITYYVGVILAGSLIVWEQSLVKPDDIRRVNLAFFTLNGWISVCLFVFVLLDSVIHL
jgi:4-hydroxybenzoate polyprenyltransferase